MHVMRRGGRRKYHRCRALVCLVLLVVSILPFGQLLKKLSASFSIYAWKRFIGFGEDIDGIRFGVQYDEF